LRGHEEHLPHRLDGSTIAEWNIQKSIPNGDMSGDGRPRVARWPEAAARIDMNEEAIARIGTARCPRCGSSTSVEEGTRLTPKKQFGWTVADRYSTVVVHQPGRRRKDRVALQDDLAR